MNSQKVIPCPTAKASAGFYHFPITSCAPICRLMTSVSPEPRNGEGNDPAACMMDRDQERATKRRVGRVEGWGVCGWDKQKTAQCLWGLTPVLLPIMMPLGSTGGCQMTRTSVSRTSGNTSLTGGPGTAHSKDSALEHITQVCHALSFTLVTSRSLSIPLVCKNKGSLISVKHV